MPEISHTGPPAGLRLNDQQTDQDSHVETEEFDPDAELNAPEPEDAVDDEVEVEEEQEPDESGSAGEGAEDVDATGTPAPSAPEYLPQGIDWNGLDDKAKILVQHAYEKGRHTEQGAISDEERAVLTQYRKLNTRAEDRETRPTPPELAAPVIDLPDEYKDDPGLSKVFGGVNHALAEQTRLNNALVKKVYQLNDQLEKVAGSGSEMARNMAWAQFTGLHPEVADEKVWSALNEQLQYVNPSLPEYQQWELALRFSGVKPTKLPAKDQVDDMEERIRRGRAVRAASSVSTRNVGRRVAKVGTPASELRGKSFEDVWRYEKKNGALPSQTRR